MLDCKRAATPGQPARKQKPVYAGKLVLSIISYLTIRQFERVVEICSNGNKSQTQDPGSGNRARGTLRVSVSCERENYCLTIVIDGMGEAESASGLSLLWKIPNHYPAVSGAIDRGVPLMQQNRSDLTRAFTGLAEKLTETEAAAKRPTWSLFKIG